MNFNIKYENMSAQVSDIGPSWSSCFCLFSYLDINMIDEIEIVISETGSFDKVCYFNTGIS